MPENKVKIELEARGDKVVNTLNQTERQVKAFGDHTVATFRRVNASIQAFSSRAINSLSMLGVGFGAGELIKGMVDFDASLRKIGRTGGYSGQQIRSLRQDILGLIDPAAKLKIPLEKGEFVDIATELNNVGMSLKTIRDIMPQIGKGAVASHTGPAVYAEAIGTMMTKVGVAAKDLPALQEQLNRALKFSDVRRDPEALLNVLTSLAKPMQIIGATGLKNFTPLVAALGQIAEVSGGAGEAGTSMEALLNGLFRLSKNQKMLQGLHGAGINFFDKGKMKDVSGVLAEVKKLDDYAKAHHMDVDALAMQVFGRPEAGKAVMIIAQHYEEIMKKQKELSASSGDLERDFLTESTAMSSKVKELINQFDEFKTTHMEGAIKLITFALDELNRHPLVAKGLIVGLLGAGGLVMLEKFVSAINGLAGVLGGGKGGGMMGGAGIPVYVTNLGGLGVRAAAAAAAVPLAVPAVVGGVLAATTWATNHGGPPAGWSDQGSQSAYYAAERQRIFGAGGANHIHLDINIGDTHFSAQSDDGKTKIDGQVKRGRF